MCLQCFVAWYCSCFCLFLIWQWGRLWDSLVHHLMINASNAFDRFALETRRSGCVHVFHVWALVCLCLLSRDTFVRVCLCTRTSSVCVDRALHVLHLFLLDCSVRVGLFVPTFVTAVKFGGRQFELHRVAQLDAIKFSEQSNQPLAIWHVQVCHSKLFCICQLVTICAVFLFIQCI